ncbi:hypothetical protein [Alicyclobacillus ferrooxydans]|uniref:Uncharacterized protein n=1 Tax=Alicyclobacillus ferrooxydans TaxID=471514 RepID=A0A0P9C9H9_9BACL|nr:hypothetical protein [Alicyclobacillus ferrooxydans]KPV42018.1 hypothetical protein AN477_19815 [Alicyclobacillus ferrooxydans]
MSRYKCVKRLTTDNRKTIHEVGDIVELNDEDARSALRQGAVVAVEDTSTKASKTTPASGGDGK